MYLERRYFLNILTNKRKYKLSDNIFFPLTELETDWIAQELSEWLSIPVTDSNETNKKLNNQLLNVHQINASKCLEADNYEDAIKHSTSAIELNSKAYKSYFMRGLARWKLRRNIPRAIKDIEKAQEIATQHQYTEFVEKAVALLEEINKC